MTQESNNRAMTKEMIAEEKFGGSVHPATLMRWAKEGKFLDPFYLGSRPFWLEANVDEFIAEKAQQANHAA